MTIKLLKLGDILQFQAKSHRKAGDGLVTGVYPFFTSSQHQTKWLDKADYRAPSLILGTGGVANIHYATEFSTSADTFALISRDKEISIKYVFYFLSGNKQILERGFKGVGLKHLSRDYVEKISIPFPVKENGDPDLSEQLRVVGVLEEAEDLRQKRVEADAKTSQVIPSIYSQFFKNKEWPQQRIEEVIPEKGAMRTGPFGSDLLHSEFTEEGVPVLGIDNVVLNRFQWAEKRCVPPSKYLKFKRFRVYPKDVLVTIMGTVGRACVAPDDLPECMSTKHLCVITLDLKKINPRYLWAALLYDDQVRHQTKQVAKGAIMEGWNSTIIKNLIISVPPISLQNEFAEAVQLIESYRGKQRESAEKIDGLFKVVVSSAFTGQL